MKKIVLICPYFGKLPKEHFQLWLESCRYNPTVDWLIITDDEDKYNYPSNVLVKYMSFYKCRELFKKKLEKNIYLENPYKFCDYRPMFGYIFQDWISNYDFWGHCDISDTIYGNIRKYISDDVLEIYDKIFFLGHLSLYRNVTYMNELFMQETVSSISWKDVADKNYVVGFDENTQYGVGIGFKLRDLKYKQFRNDECIVDILPDRYSFSENSFNEEYSISYIKNQRFICEWNKGELWKLSIADNQLVKKEVCYVHFQKRKLIKRITAKTERYLIVPNYFLPYKDVNINFIMKYSRNSLFYGQALKLKYKNYKYRIKKRLGRTEVYK